MSGGRPVARTAPLLLLPLLAGCHATVAATPRTVAWYAPLAAEAPGECDPVEYYVAARRPLDVRFRVALGEDGRARDLAFVGATGEGASDDQAAFAADVVRHLFRCRRPLAPDASRFVQGYTLHFAPLVEASVEPGCGADLRFPPGALDKALEADVHVGVGLAADGRLTVAWVDGATGAGFAEASVGALRKCRFGSARLGDRPIPFFLRYTTRFVYQ